MNNKEETKMTKYDEELQEIFNKFKKCVLGSEYKLETKQITFTGHIEYIDTLIIQATQLINDLYKSEVVLNSGKIEKILKDYQGIELHIVTKNGFKELAKRITQVGIGGK